MSVSAVSIANMALGHLGIAKTISALNERSSEARACNRFYTRAREITQSRYPWKNGLRRDDLTELADNAWLDEFLHAYRTPTDCEWFRRICVGQGVGAKGPTFRIVSDEDGEVVLTDTADANAEYSILVEEPERWTTEQVEATAYKLASLMARTFDEDNASSTRKEMDELFEIEVSRAAAKDFNQEEPPEKPKSEFQTGRY